MTTTTKSTMMAPVAVLLAAVMMMLLVATMSVSADEPQCGWQAGGKVCPNCFCCSEEGFCGNTTAWCSNGCQSQCNGCDDGVASILSRSEFDEMLKQQHDNDLCPGKGFYTYDAFIDAAKTFPSFGVRGGDVATRKREVAAFLAQTSHETMLGWEAADGSVTWAGYCLKEQAVEPRGDCCQPSRRWPCAEGKQYYGRGPFNISWNYNYGAAGNAIGVGDDLLHDPDMVATDAVVSFKTALWFWMTPRSSELDENNHMPSCHLVMTGQWGPTEEDLDAGRVPGYGAVTNLVNGEAECGHGGPDDRVESRIAFYKRYCDILGVDYGDKLDCYGQKPFPPSPTPQLMIRKVVDA
ncbi:hypothetical protein HU200_049217 [Digitaria exilis]|uniref:chitinase n=1 Tax=Digitaria exilis TaxID=1010633 RepID=A0A835E8R2_9POAL|nr:hypothetical protein HU200_049217 [Digitaria exilis]